MKQLKPMLYEIVCQECNNIYNYKLYTSDIIISSETKPKYSRDTIVLQSHGICELCEPIVYKKNGLEKEYKAILERRIKNKAD
jgi:hypothetical protein